MDLILPKFVKDLLEFFIVLFAVEIVCAVLIFYFSFESVGYIPLKDVFFVLNLLLIFAIFFMVILYQYTDEIVIYISIITFFTSAISSIVSIYFHLEALPFIGYMALSILIIIHKKNYLEII